MPSNPIRTALVLSICGATSLPAQQSDADLLARARAIHARVLTLDTHVDIDPADFTATRNYAADLPTQVTLPKMERGGLDAAFFVVYVRQRPALDGPGYDAAYRAALDKFAAIHRLADEIAPDRIGLARSASEARAIHDGGRKVALIGVENGYPLGEDLGRIREFAERGARYLSLAHNGPNQLSDSHTGATLHRGLSPLGRRAVAELNRWGVMVDVSHPSRASMLQMAELTKAPLVASHSAVRALCDHSRNLDDEQLDALARTGGVVQVVALSRFLICRDGDAAVSDLVDHIDYAVRRIGIDHVGISSDFDGGGGVVGWRDAGETLGVTVELVRRGYTEADIAKLWGGNLLRVMEQVERIGRELRGER
ncbi:MAG: dipeptidase [Gemmatimonadales bacterium]